MKLSLQSPSRKRLITGVALVLATVYLGLVTREFAASIANSRSELTWLKAAAWLDPGSAEYRNHVGRYYDLVARDPLTALGYYKAAVQLNPHSADFWFDLAGAYQILADTANQTAALDHAIQAEPTKPDVAWTAANFFLVRGENQKALREFRVVMANDSSLANAAMALCWRINPDVDLLLRDAVPPTADAYVAFLTLLGVDVTNQLRRASAPTDDTDVAAIMSKADDETAGTFKVWNALMQIHQPFEKHYAYDYIHFLITRKEVDQAVLVWRQSSSLFQQSSYLASSNNLVVNGSFGLEVLNNGFDWQYQKQSGVELVFDLLDPKRPDGPRAMMITFDGPGISDAGLYQFVPVQPNTEYQFTAQFKTKGEQEGQGGPHFAVTDYYHQQVDFYTSDELQNQDSWTPVVGNFTTGPDCKLIVLHVRRVPAGSPIRGKLWVDDFRITRKPS
jgi:tetratricopeptide (TPR) repeat protein